MNHTQQELQAAFTAMRTRPAFQSWPTDLSAVMTDPIRARLVRLEATGRRRRYRALPYRTARQQPRRPLLAPAPAPLDIKRRAAGDFDE